nr:hypothetical protein GCM10020093_104990 [Planobispora longispora]
MDGPPGGGAGVDAPVRAGSPDGSGVSGGVAAGEGTAAGRDADGVVRASAAVTSAEERGRCAEAVSGSPEK